MNSISQPNIQRGIFLSFLSLVLLGILPVISNSRPPGLGALNFALYLSIWQFICSLPVVGIELSSNRRGIFAAKLSPADRNKTVLIILLTGLIFGASTFAYVLSVEKAGTVSAAIAIQAYPLFAILLESLFLNRRKSKGELCFTFLLIVALYYLGTNGTWKIEGLSFWFILALGVPFLWSIAHLLLKNLLDSTPITPGQVTFFRVFISSVVLLIVSMIINGPNNVLYGMSSFNFQIYAMFMGFVYYLELINWFYAIKHVDVSVASSITTPWPVVTMILATVFLHETIVHYQIIAMIVVFVSLYGILYAGKRKRVIAANSGHMKISKEKLESGLSPEIE